MVKQWSSRKLFKCLIAWLVTWIGRIDHVENRLVGIKSREVYEAPAALTLIKAHQALESLVFTRDLAHFKPLIEQQIAKSIYEGMWYSPLFYACVALSMRRKKW